jgi:hypothetical protein
MGIRDLFKKKSTKELKKELQEEELKLKIYQAKERKRKGKIKLKSQIAESKKKRSFFNKPSVKKASKIAKSIAIGFGENIAAQSEIQRQEFGKQRKSRKKTKKRKPKKQMGFENPFDLGF